MSRALVKEDDDQTVALPDRPLSEHRNYVTQHRLAVPYAPLRTLSHGISKGDETSVRPRCLTLRTPTTLDPEKDTFFVA
jgi:hypothetical protein